MEAQHVLTIPNWHPARLNELLAGRWQAAKLKKADRQIVAVYAFDVIPHATGKRRVDVEIVLGPRQRACDPDAYHKSLLDALKHARLLIDDNRQHVELTPVRFSRGKQKATVITLTDLE